MGGPVAVCSLAKYGPSPHLALTAPNGGLLGLTLTLTKWGLLGFGVPCFANAQTVTGTLH